MSYVRPSCISASLIFMSSCLMTPLTYVQIDLCPVLVTLYYLLHICESIVRLWLALLSCYLLVGLVWLWSCYVIPWIFSWFGSCSILRSWCICIVVWNCIYRRWIKWLFCLCVVADSLIYSYFSLWHDSALFRVCVQTRVYAFICRYRPFFIRSIHVCFRNIG